MAEERLHWRYLDGLRGWAAIFVVLHHVWQFEVTQASGTLPRWFSSMAIFRFGSFAVTIFIVLSGYCLMLPAARVSPPRLSSGLAQFLLRRARRILPPYYATLILTLGLISVYPPLQERGATHWNIALPALTAGSLFSHALLVHNWMPQWQWTIDPPLWSVALEWQIYFVFGAALLSLWRRVGAVTVLISFAVGLIPLAFGGGFASTWYLGSFSLGMLAAVLNFAPDRSEPPAMAGRKGVALMICFLVPVALSMLRAFRSLPSALVDSCLSVAVAIFLARTTDELSRGHVSRLARILEHRWCVRIGEFSYSLYLIHFPLVAVLAVCLRSWGIAPAHAFLISVLFGLPLLLAAAYGFHYVFERPFLHRKPAKKLPVAGGSEWSPQSQAP